MTGQFTLNHMKMKICQVILKKFSLDSMKATQIKIHFNDLAEKPLTFYHVLKLFHNAPGNPSNPAAAAASSSASSPADASTTTTAVIQGRKSVISECYDEVIFQDPTQYMYTLLTTTRKLTLAAHKHDTNVEERKARSLAKI